LVHDLEVSPDASSSTAARLIQAARNAIRDRGLRDCVFTVEVSNELMLKKCLKAGMIAEAVTFRGKV
jgi:hypothetical protein